MASQTELSRLGIAGRLGTGGCFANASTGTIPAEGHLRINKKIAQLTKVIIALNEKCEDHDYTVSCLKYEHRAEIEGLRKILTKEKDEAAASLCGANDTVAELTLAISEDKKVRAAEQARAEEAESERQKLQSSVEEVQHSLATATAECEKLMAERRVSEARLEAAAKDTKDRYEKLLSREQEERQTAIEVARRERDKLASSFEEYKSTSQEPYNCLKKQFEQLQKQGTDGHKQLREDLAASQARASENVRLHKAEMDTLTQQHADTKEELARLKANLSSSSEHYRREVESLNTQLAEALTDKQSASSALQTANEKLAETQRQLTSSLAAVSSTTECREKLQVDIDNLQSQLAVQRVACDGMEKEARKRAADLGALQAECAQLRSLTKTQNEELSRLNSHCLQLEKAKAALEANQDDSRTTLNRRVQDLEKEIADLIAFQERTKAQYAREIESLQSKFTSNEGKLRSQHEAEVKKMEQKLKQQSTELSKKVEMQQATLQAKLAERHQSERHALQEEHSRKVSASNERIAKLEDSLSTMEERLNRQTALLEESRTGLDGASTELQMLRQQVPIYKRNMEKSAMDQQRAEKERAKLQAELSSLQESTQSSQQSLEKQHVQHLQRQKATLDSEWTERLRVESERLRNELDGQQAVVQRSAIDRLNEMSHAQLEAIKAERQASEDKLSRNIDKLEGEVVDLQHALNESRKAVERQDAELETTQKQLDASKVQMRSELAAASTRYQSMHCELVANIQKLKEEMEDQAAKHSKELDGRRKEERQQIASLHDQKDRSKAAALQQAAHDTECRVVQLRQELEMKMSCLLRDKDAEHENQQKADEERHSQAMEDVHCKMTAVECQLRIVQGSNATQNETIQTLTSSQKRSQQDIDTLSSTVAAKEEMIEQQAERTRTALVDMKTALETEYQAIMDATMQDCRLKLEQVAEKVREREDAWHEQVAILEEELKNANERLTERPSRPEDLEMICDQQGRLQDQEQTLAKLKGSVKTYAVELKNRDETLNKVFLSASKVPSTLKVADDPLWFMKGKHKGNQLPPISRQGSAPQLNSPKITKVGPVQQQQQQQEEKLKSRSSGSLVTAAHFQKQRLQQMKGQSLRADTGTAQESGDSHTAVQLPPVVPGTEQSLLGASQSGRTPPVARTADRRAHPSPQTSTRHRSRSRIPST